MPTVTKTFDPSKDKNVSLTIKAGTIYNLNFSKFRFANYDNIITNTNRTNNTLILKYVVDGNVKNTLTLYNYFADSRNKENVKGSLDGNNYFTIASAIEVVVSEYSESTIPVTHTPTFFPEYVFGSNYDDTITTGKYDDYIYAFGGNDTINAGDGKNIIYGDYLVFQENYGNDTITSGSGNDTIYGGLGNDTIRVKSGTNIIYGDFDADSSWSGDNKDTIYGGTGTDKIYGGTGDDNLHGGSGNDYIYGGYGNDKLYGDAGNDKLYGDYGDDIITGGTGNDTIDDRDGSNTYIFNKNDGNDTINYVSGADKLVFNALTDFSSVKISRNSIGQFTIDYGSGTVQIKEWQDDNTDNITLYTKNQAISSSLTDIINTNGYIVTSNSALTFSKNYGENVKYRVTGSSKNDSIETGNLNDTIYGNSGNDTIKGGSGNDYIKGDNGNDKIYGENGNDKIYGGSGDDYIKGGNDNDSLYGDSGNDKIYGDNGNDSITGGTGNDYLDGGSGDDIYYIGKNDGNDTIINSAGTDSIKFTSESDISKLSYKTSGNNLLIYHNSGKSYVTLKDYLKTPTSYGVKYILDSKNNKYTLYDKINIIQKGNTGSKNKINGSVLKDTIYGGNNNDTLNGGSGNDKIYGGKGNDSITGGTGNDYLDGGSGDDIYYIGKNDGNDTIINSAGTDSIKFTSESDISKLSYKTSGNNLLIYHNSGKSYVTLKDYLKTPTSYGVKYILDSKNNKYNLYDKISINMSGSTDSANTIKGSVVNDNIIGGNLNDTMYGNSGNDTIKGGAGNDYIKGDNGNDKIYGENGNDKIYGGSGDDYIKGGNDNDSLYGDSGNDKIYGDNGNDSITGGTGNDYLDGGAGDDIYYIGKNDGNDTIINSAGTDSIKFTSESDISKLSYKTSGNNLLIYHNSGKSYVTLKDYLKTPTSYGVKYILDSKNNKYTLYDKINIIKKGNTSSKNKINGSVLKDTIYGGNNNDTLNGGSGNDKIYGGKGNDSITGGTGSNSLYFYSGDGSDTVSSGGGTDTLIFEKSNLIDIKFKQSGNNLIVYGYGSSSDKITVKDYFLGNSSVKQIKAKDGTIPLPTDLSNLYRGTSRSDTIYANADDNTMYGYAGDDLLSGRYGEDKIYGGTGNDVIDGGNNNDYLAGDDGNDVISGGEGNDVIYGGNGDDIIFGGYGSYQTGGYWLDPRSGRYVAGQDYDGNDIIDYNGEEFVCYDYDGNNTIYAGNGHDIVVAGQNNDIVYGGSGRDIILGYDGNDRLYGEADNDIIIAGKGDDYIDGGSGNNTYEFYVGDGDDVIANGTGNDTIKFRNEVNLSYEKDLSTNDLIIRYNGYNNSVWGSGNITLKDYFKNNTHSVKTIINNKQSYNLDEIISGMTFTLNGSCNDDTILGTSHGDIIYANGGNDNIDSGDGDDTIYLQYGNNTLNCGNGNDIVYTGDGNDIINGGSGNNTYIIDSNQGNVTIYNGNGNDTIQFNTATTLQYAKNSNDLIITAGTGKIITLKDYFVNNSHSVKNIQNGENVLNLSNELSTQKLNLYGTSGDDTIYGTTHNDVIDGGAGQNIYCFNVGSGHDTIINGLGTDTIYFANKVQLSYNVSSVNNHDLIISYSDTDSITLKDYFINNSHSVKTIINFDETITLNEVIRINVVNGTQYNDTLTGVKGITNYIYGYNGNDNIYAANDNSNNEYIDYIYAGDGDDNIYAYNKTFVDAGNGNDIIYSWWGSTITAGAGNDEIAYLSSTNTLIFHSGDGQDTISDCNSDCHNIIKLADLYSWDNVYYYNGSLHYTQNDTINLYNILWKGSREIDNIVELANGERRKLDAIQKGYFGTSGDDTFQNGSANGYTIYTYGGNDTITVGYNCIVYAGDGNDTILSYGSTIYGGDGNDTITSYNNNYIDGGNGNNTINGGTGDNIYVNQNLTSHDTIKDDGGNDTILITNVNKDDLMLSFNVLLRGDGTTASGSGLTYDTDSMDLNYGSLFISLKEDFSTNANGWINNTTGVRVVDYFREYYNGNSMSRPYQIEKIQTADGYFATSASINHIRQDVANWLVEHNYYNGLYQAFTDSNNYNSNISSLVAIFDSAWQQQV